MATEAEDTRTQMIVVIAAGLKIFNPIDRTNDQCLQEAEEFIKAAENKFGSFFE